MISTATAPADVLLAGCGDLNAEVGRRLSSQGHRVIGVRRRSVQSSVPFTVLQRDLAEPGTQKLPAAKAVVVALTADRRDAAGYQRSYRSTLTGLAAMLPQAPQRLIFISSTSVLGDYHGQVVTERTPPAPVRETAKVLLAAERDAAELFGGTVIVRPAGIYGPGRRRIIDRVLDGRPADHSRITNRVHRDDLVTTIETLLKIDQPPRLLHAADAEPAPLGQVLEFLARRLGVPTPPDGRTGRLTGKTVDSTRLHRMLGEPGLRFPSFREGYADLLAADEQSPHSPRK